MDVVSGSAAAALAVKTVIAESSKKPWVRKHFMSTDLLEGVLHSRLAPFSKRDLIGGKVGYILTCSGIKKCDFARMFGPTLLVFLLTQTLARGADSVENHIVTDSATLASCYAVRPYLLEQTAAGRKTVHLIDEREVASACTLKAVALGKTKAHDTSLVIALADQVRKGDGKGAALNLYKIAVDGDKAHKACTDETLYSVMIDSLAAPAVAPKTDINNALNLVHACLANEQFRQDIQEEPARNKGYVAENLCPVLLAEKIGSNCNR